MRGVRAAIVGGVATASMLVGGVMGAALASGGAVVANAATSSASTSTAATAPGSSSAAPGKFVSNEDPTHEAGESAQREAQENAGQAPTVP